MSDEAFKDLMGRMQSAVSSSKTAHAHVKQASIDELEEPGDILANTIYGMNDEIRRRSFPDEMPKEAESEIEADDLDDDTDAKTAEEYEVEEASHEKSESKKKEKKEHKGLPAGFAEHMKSKKEAGFGLSVEEDLSNPLVALGFNAELKEHEPVIKQAVAKIVRSAAVK